MSFAIHLNLLLQIFGYIHFGCLLCIHACNGFMCRIKKVGPAHVHKKGSSIIKQ